MAAIGRYINLACSLPHPLLAIWGLMAFMHVSRWEKKTMDATIDPDERGEPEMLWRLEKYQLIFPRRSLLSSLVSPSTLSWNFRCFRQHERYGNRAIWAARNENHAKWDTPRGENVKLGDVFLCCFYAVTDKKMCNNSFVVLTNLPAMLRSCQVYRKCCCVSYNCILLQLLK